MMARLVFIKAWNGSQHPRDMRGRFAFVPDTGVNPQIAIKNEREKIIEKLEEFAVPIDKTDFSKEAYSRAFIDDRIKTPIGEVIIGKNQYEKLRDKDSGNRQILIGAMRQTLSDPIVVISETKGDKKAHIYIKSFKDEGEKDFSTVMSVVVDKDGQQVSVSTYQRKKREITEKIKKAGGIVYTKNNTPQLNEQDNTHQLLVSPETLKKSTIKLGILIKKGQKAVI